jgi:hypothetical protein
MLYFSAFYIQSKNYPTYYWGPGSNGQDYKIVTPEGTKLYMISPGLTGEVGTVSFQPVNAPGYYLRHYNFLVDVEQKLGARNAHIFDLDATFRVHEDKYFNGFNAFESVNYHHYYIRHQSYRLKISEHDTTDLYKNDASFKTIACKEKHTSHIFKTLPNEHIENSQSITTSSRFHCNNSFFAITFAHREILTLLC